MTPNAGPSHAPNVLQFALPLALVAGLIALSASSPGSSRSSATTVLALAVVIAMIAVSTSQSSTAPYLAVRVRVPTNYVLGAVKLDLVDGSVTAASDSFTVSSLEVDLCGAEASETATVSLDQLISITNVKVCAQGAVSVTKLVMQGSAATLDVESLTSTATVSVSKFKGSVNLGTGSGAITQTGTDACTFTTNSALSKVGSCGTGLQTLRLMGKTAATFTMVVGGGVCPTGWTSDPVAPANVPSSPAISTAPRQVVIDMTNDDFLAVSAWGGVNYGYAPKVSATGSVVMTFDQYYSNSARLYNPRIIGFVKGAAASVSFKPKIVGASNTVTALKLYSLYSPPITWGGVVEIGNQLNLTTSKIITNTVTLTAGNGLPTVWDGTATATFNLPTSTADFGGYLLLAIEYNGGSNKAYTFEFIDFQFANTFTPPSTGLQTGDSEVVEIYKMPAALDPNPRTAAVCPHLATGLKNWHDASTWPSGTVPTATENIEIPANTAVLISSCSLLPSNFVYQKIHIPVGSKLVFSDAEISLRVKNIFVEGEMLIGSPECRLNSYIDIEFVGAKTANDDIGPSYGSKGIGVSGTIDIHGYQYHPTWTRLANTIYSGNDVIMIQDANNWEIGQQIVVSTSAMKDLTESDFNEVRTISAIDMGGKRIQVSEPFSFYHYAGAEHQVEVGLLSRRITMHGDAQSDVAQFGGHTRVTGTGRFSGVQSYKMGQKNMLGKYPFHFHAMGPSPLSYVKDCSIVDSYFRCIAIHQTNDSQALRNVVFNATAHCIYLEDGVEENNTINYNLAVKVNVIGTPMKGQSQIGDVTTESTNLILPADSAAAGFYITNAYNTFIGNAASGGWAGFSFPNLPAPIGISRTWWGSPMQRPTLVFQGNTAHSSGYLFPGGGCMYTGGKLYYPTGSNLLSYDNGRYSRNTLNAKNTGPGIQYFNDSKTWLCGIGISHWGDRIEIIGYEGHDNARSVQVFGEAWFTKGLVNVKSKSLVTFYDIQSNPMGFQFYDTWVKSAVTNVIFRGFTANSPAYNWEASTSPYEWLDKRAFTSLIHSDIYKPQGISATKGIVFQNTDRTQYFGHKYMETGAARYTNFVDWDGSFGGTAGTAQILGDARGWWNWNTQCVLEAAWGFHRCPRGDRQVVFANLYIPGVIDGSGTDRTNEDPSTLYIGQTYLFGPGLPSGTHNATLTRSPGVTGISKQGWYWHFTKSGAPRTFTLYPALFPTGQWTMNAFRYPAGTTFTITYTYNWGTVKTVAIATSFSDLMANTDGLKYWWDSTNNYLYVKLQNTMSNAGEGYTRDGVTIWDITNGAWYSISTSNCGSTSTYCPETAYRLPTVTW